MRTTAKSTQWRVTAWAACLLAASLAPDAGAQYAGSFSAIITWGGQCGGSQRNWWDDMCMAWRHKMGDKGWVQWWRNFHLVQGNRYADNPPLAPPEVTSAHGDEPIYINVTTLAQPAVVTISQPANPAFNGGTPIVLNMAANTAQRYKLTSLKAQLETRPTNAVLNTGLLISATANITCYYEPSFSNNPDIAALKGANSLGTEFYIPLHKHAPFYNHGFAAPNLAYASVDIVATENGTLVMIYSPVPVDGHPALTPFTVTLNRGQTYSSAWTGANYTDPATHPSGAVVLSNKPVAISIKDDSNHNPSGGCYDLMLDQIVPVNIRGHGLHRRERSAERDRRRIVVLDGRGEQHADLHGWQRNTSCHALRRAVLPARHGLPHHRR